MVQSRPVPSRAIKTLSHNVPRNPGISRSRGIPSRDENSVPRKALKNSGSLLERLIIMQIRFRASDFDLVAKINIIGAKSKQASCAEMVLGSFDFFARVIQHLGFWTQKIEAKVNYCYVRRRAECTSLGPGLEHPSLCSDSSLAAKRRAEALRVVFF